jgi:5-hydroxyisourate hydrolase
MGISTHILDTTIGRPAAGVTVTLEREESGEWSSVNSITTDQDGRCRSLLPEWQTLTTGRYRIRFDTGAYFASQKVKGLYPRVDITFEVVEPTEHYHIPLLLTANGYTTYRGS